MADHRDTLLLPFEKGLIAEPVRGENWAFLNADLLPVLDNVLIDVLSCEQGRRGGFLGLREAGYRVEPELGDPGLLAGCLILASRSKLVNQWNLTRAWNGLRPGGILLFAGAKTSGVQSARKWSGSRTEIGGSLSKNHAVVFWLFKQGDNWPLAEQQMQVDGYEIRPGMFSATGPDKGSQVLCSQFDARIGGNIGDFGAGWGYLSRKLLEACPGIGKLDLYETDWASLEAARTNIGSRADYHWVDITREAPRGPFDWIVMNPPFHTDRAALPELGNQFIEAAARALPSGGRLLMVANTNLPYERSLNSHFSKVERLTQESGFKVLEAQKGRR